MVAVGGFVYKIVYVGEMFEVSGKRYYSQIDHEQQIIWLSTLIPANRMAGIERRAIEQANIDVKELAAMNPPFIGETEA